MEKIIAPIKIQTREKVFFVSQENLTKYPDSKLAKAFSQKNAENMKLNDGSIYLNRNSQCFEYILEYLESGMIPQIENTLAEMVFKELIYWELPFPNDKDWFFYKNDTYGFQSKRPIQFLSNVCIDMGKEDRFTFYVSEDGQYFEEVRLKESKQILLNFDSRDNNLTVNEKTKLCNSKLVWLRIDYSYAFGKAPVVVLEEKNQRQ